MRRSDLVKTMQWKHIDLDARVAHLLDTKGSVPRNVPLSVAAVGSLRGLPDPHKGHVFRIKPDAITLAFGRARKLARGAYEQQCSERAEDTIPTSLQTSVSTMHGTRRHPRYSRRVST